MQGGLWMKVGIIGAGAIAQFLLSGDIKIKSILVRNKKKYEWIEKECGVQLYDDIDDFLKSNIDIVVEAANIEAVHHYLPKILDSKDAIIISIGAFADEEFTAQIFEQAQKNERQIHLPAGAIGGLDLLQNANSLGEIEEVKITTIKPAHTLTDDVLIEEKTIFSGTAKEAIQKFPKNINVSIILSLTGLGVDRTKVEIIADPKAKKNQHRIYISGAFGTSTITVMNEPMKQNPKTSYLAALSVLGTLQRLMNPFQLG